MRHSSNTQAEAVEYKMAIDKKNLRILLIISIALIIFGSQETLSKRAVADIEGKACTENKDCPCWGKLETGEEAFGIGVATCSEDTKTCDTSFCVDVQPVGKWLKDNPFQWAKNNIILVFGIIGLIMVFVYWPKQ